MTECTEVSYVVPSYFFLRCRRSSEEMKMLYNFRNEGETQHNYRTRKFSLRPYFFLRFN